MAFYEVLCLSIKYETILYCTLKTKSLFFIYFNIITAPLCPVCLERVVFYEAPPSEIRNVL